MSTEAHKEAAHSARMRLGWAAAVAMGCLSCRMVLMALLNEYRKGLAGPDEPGRLRVARTLLAW